MNCADVTPHLEAYLHGELDPGRMRGMQLHLGGCFACREQLLETRGRADVVVPFYLALLIHGEATDAERAAVEPHLAWCEPCRSEFEQIRQAANEILKNLSQYQLTRAFRVRIMQEWKPHRVGRRARYNQRGLADMIERAEAGNTFSYERHVDHFKDYAYLAAYLHVRDFHWASEIARLLFVRGMPPFRGELSQADFLRWLDKQVCTIADEGGWLGKDDDVGDTAEGLSGYAGSRKLRRHRLILAMHERFDEAHRMPFLLFYVQRLRYAEIGALLELGRVPLMTILQDTTRQAAAILQEDDRQHPRRRRLWE